MHSNSLAPQTFSVDGGTPDFQCGGGTPTFSWGGGEGKACLVHNCLCMYHYNQMMSSGIPLTPPVLCESSSESYTASGKGWVGVYTPWRLFPEVWKFRLYYSGVGLWGSAVPVAK